MFKGLRPTWTEKGKGQYKNKNDKSSQPTEQEWVQYYKIIGDEQHGDFVYHTQDGGRAVILCNKLVFDNGSFEKPIVNNVLTFFDDVTMSSTIDYINRMGYIK